MPTVTADGATGHCTSTRETVGGQHPALVLVAGTGLDAQLNFGHLADAFAASHTVYLPDYSGHLVVFERPQELVAEVLGFLNAS